MTRVTGALHNTSAEKLNKELGWETLGERASCLGLSIFHKIHLKHTRPLVRQYMPECNFRDNNKYIQFRYINQKFNNSFFPFYCKLWNKLPLNQRKLNIDDFKLELKQIYKPKRYKHYAKGNKLGCTLLTQIRLQRSYLNAHAFEIGKSISPKCLCEHPNENSQHYITGCWLFTEERRILYDKVEQFIPNFRSLPLKRKYFILVNGYDIDNNEDDPRLYIENKTFPEVKLSSFIFLPFTHSYISFFLYL